MKHLFKQPLFYTTVISLLALGLIIASYVFGWTTPTQNPPAGNITLQSVTPGGSTGYIQFNNSGTFGGDAGLFWDNTNKRLGIGTTGPVNKLDISGNLGILGGNYLRLYNSSNSAWASITFNGSSVTGDYPWSFTDTGTHYIAGNVGIGTTAPGEKLEVAGNIKLSGSSPTYKITNVVAPTASSDVATKGYVDAATAGVKYWSIQATPTAYNGNLGGYSGYLAKCQSAFGTGAIPFSSLMLSNALRGSVVIAINYDASKTYWWEGLATINDVSVGGGGTSSGGNTPAAPYFWYYGQSSTLSNCVGWTSGSSGFYGVTIDGTSTTTYGGAFVWTCDHSFPLLCAVPN